MIIGIIKTLRPKQWSKNLLVFAPIIFDLKLFQIELALKTVLGFVTLCFISGTVYIINDIVDIDKDRHHPTKRFRPLPSGQITVNTAISAALLLVVTCLPFSFILDFYFGITILCYLILQIAYSFKLKNIILIDVLTIALGFVLRVAGGVFLVDAERFSPWLYLFTTMGALFLGFGKRRQELVLLDDKTSKTRTILKKYNLPLIDEMMSIVTASTVMTYSFYTFSAPNLPDNHMMMLTIPFVIYGIFRYLYVIHVQGNGGAPDEVFLTDRPLQISIILFGITTITILYGQHL